MHKNIFALCFIAMSSLVFSMDQINQIKEINVILGSIYNKSDSFYCMTCKEQQDEDKNFPFVLDPFETVTLNLPLLTVKPDQNFSVEKTIFLSEILPYGFPPKGWIKHVLYLTLTQSLSEKTQNDRIKKYSFFSAVYSSSVNDEKANVESPKKWRLDFNGTYTFHIIIDREDKMFFSWL